MTRVGLVAVALLLSACSQSGCEEAADCADLLFHGESYDEYRTIDADPPGQLEELGNATYPACNCDPDDLGGLGATDVWRLDESTAPTRSSASARGPRRTSCSCGSVSTQSRWSCPTSRSPTGVTLVAATRAAAPPSSPWYY